MFNDTINNLLNLMGRLLLASVFLPGGVQKLSAYAGTQRYMKAMGVPGGLLPLVIALQIGGGLALIIGFKVPWAALALGGFLILASVGRVHTDWTPGRTNQTLFPIALLRIH